MRRCAGSFTDVIIIFREPGLRAGNIGPARNVTAIGGGHCPDSEKLTYRKGRSPGGLFI